MEEIVVIFVCLILNALFAAYEMAFVSVPKAELRKLARTGDQRAKVLISLRENPERTLSIIQVGITLVGAIAAVVGGAGASESIEPYFIQNLGFSESVAEAISVILVVLPITFLSVVIGELVPKTLALRNPKKIVLAGARWLLIFDKALSPIIGVLEWSTHLLIKIFFKRSKGEEVVSHTTIEIDSFSPVHQKLILNMAGIENKKIKDILLPWNQVLSIKDSFGIEEVLAVVISSGHTRLPVTNNGSVVGILHTKEFVALRESGEKVWQSIIRPTLIIKPLDSALGVLRLMQEKRNHMAVVFSPSNERLGIVTLEDIFEEVFGDIFDEDDDGKVRKIFAAKAKIRFIPNERL